jgi:hypothetical protein
VRHRKPNATVAEFIPCRTTAGETVISASPAVTAELLRNRGHSLAACAFLAGRIVGIDSEKLRPFWAFSA